MSQKVTREAEPVQSIPEIVQLPVPNAYVTHWHNQSRSRGHCTLCGKLVAEGESVSTITFEFTGYTIKVRVHSACIKAKLSN